MKLSALFSALPDFAIGLAFLGVWLTPKRYPTGSLSYFLLVLLMEFIIIHSSAFMGSVLLSAASRKKRAVAVIGFACFYSVFVGGFSLAFHNAWPLATFWLLTANRLSSLLISAAPTSQDRLSVQRGWAATAIFYLAACFLTVVIPVPRFGLTAGVVAAQHLPSSGLWIEQPQRAMAFGFLYFVSVGISELFDNRWAASGVPARGSAAA